MRDTKTLVDDALLKELSAETRKIGSKVYVKQTQDQPGYSADVLDVIILPYPDFYRAKFMEYYRQYNHNSVKALKELGNNFPFVPDLGLGIAYILNVTPLENTETHPIRTRQELEFPDHSLPAESPAAERAL